MLVPDVIQKALETTPPTFRKSTSNRESMQRKRYWWLPYVVLEFDKNEILIDAMGGDLSSPVWNYRADLYVFSEYLFANSSFRSFQVMSRERPIFQFPPTCVLQQQFKVKTIWVMIYSWGVWISHPCLMGM